MGIFFFYNNRKPRKYNYQPILYNPEEEERQQNLQKRINAIKKEMNVLSHEEQNAEKADFGKEFLNQTKHLKRRKEREESGAKTFFTNNGLLIIILVVLFAVFYFWLMG